MMRHAILPVNRNTKIVQIVKLPNREPNRANPKNEHITGYEDPQPYAIESPSGKASGGAERLAILAYAAPAISIVI